MKKTETTSTVLLKHHLKALKLPTVLAECEKVAQRCAADNVDHLGYLQQLCELELVDRERRSAERRLKHPAVVSVVLGAVKPEEVEANVGDAEQDVPAGLWSDLKSAGLLDPSAPTELAFSVTGANPASGRAGFRYGLPHDSQVDISVYDVTGRRVASLAHATQAAGWHAASWSVNDDGSAPASGMYFVRFAANGQVLHTRVVMMK